MPVFSDRREQFFTLWKTTFEPMTANSAVSMIRLLTYNIHKAIGGVDRKYDLDRIASTLDHYQPDIALLQEVDAGVPRSNFDVQIEELADRLNFTHWAYQANVRLTRGHYGNAILTRFPIRDQWDVDLTIPLKKRRRALVAKVVVPLPGQDRTIFLCNLHLGLAGFERVLQLRKLMSWEHLRHLHHETPAIVGGDFNDVWGSLSRRVMVPHGFRTVSRNTRTFPAILPLRSLDAIYYRGDVHLQKSFAGHTAISRHASDHLPLIADLELRTSVDPPAM